MANETFTAAVFVCGLTLDQIPAAAAARAKALTLDFLGSAARARAVTDVGNRRASGMVIS